MHFNVDIVLQQRPSTFCKSLCCTLETSMYMEVVIMALLLLSHY